MHCVSLALGSSSACFFNNPPSGSPKFLSRTLSNAMFIALDLLYDGVVHLRIDRSRVRPVHGFRSGEGVVLGNIYELIGVEVPELVHGLGSRGFVAKGHPRTALLEPHSSEGGGI